jgi:hypothetical protein
MKKYLSIILFFVLITRISIGQIVINEYVPSNISNYANGDGSYNDWIEIYNNGASPINLQGYGLSVDSLKPYKFTFPNYILPGFSHLLVFPTNDNDTLAVDHWETPIQSDAFTLWKYFPGTSQPSTDWRNPTFNDLTWQSGPAGIGFGDGDDRTSISFSSRSVMMRKSFTITDSTKILKAVFNIDYDDGFVAYLNGYEIARANLGIPGVLPVYNDISLISHEALMFQGFPPDSFYIDPVYLRSILRQGTNVLAVEVHNESSTSNDLTAAPFLSFGIQGSNTLFPNSTPPSWFNNPGIGYLSANFKLSKSGSTIFLTNPSGTLIDRQRYNEMQSDNSVGRIPDGSNNWCVINTPTAGTSNNSSTCYIGYADKPVFSLVAGFYSSTQLLTITNTTPGGAVYYTTNGDVPTTSSTLYTGPILLSGTQTIRARNFAASYIPSMTVTNTYIINEDVHLPVFSITTDSLNLWDYNTGIYVLGPNASPISPYKGANFWQDWEKPARIEYFDRQKSRVFSFDADIKIYGNYSRAKPQKSFEIKLDTKTPSGNFKYPFYTDKTLIDNIDNIVLRNSGTDWNVVHFRDAFMERVLKPTYTGYLAAEPVVAYVNGAFWGVYCINENHDRHWMNNNYGLSRNEIDYLKESGTTIGIQEGSDLTFWEMYNYATIQNPVTTQYYNYMDSVLDLKSHVDYFSAEIFYNNGDWIGDWTNNIQLWRKKSAGSKWRYLVYDLDFGLGLKNTVNDDRLEIARNPAAFSYSSNMFDALLNNPTYKRYFINRFADLLNTIFLPSEMLPIMHQFQDSMAFDMNNHFIKWGSTPATWQGNINTMVNFINARPAIQRNHIQSQFSLNQQVTLTFNTNPAGAGRIQVSTVIPASYPWTGVYFDGNPVTITAIPNPGYTFNNWSSNHGINDVNQVTTYNFSHATETITANFTGSAQAPQLVVSEFNYHSDSIIDASDWIEFHNSGSFALDISGWIIKDQNDFDTYTFPVGTVIAPNGYLVVSSNLSKFNAAFPSVTNVIGPLGFNLSNGGDQIRLFTHTNQLYLSFFYQTTVPWPPTADGLGYTCELTSNSANLNDGNSWTTGCIGGSPGKAYTSSLVTSAQIAGNTNFCSGSSTQLYINNTPGYAYQWRRNNIDIPSAADTVYTATLSGAYSVRITYQGCSGFSDTLVANAVSNAQPPMVNANSRCGEGSVILTASAPDSIYWFDAPNGTILGTGNSFHTPTIISTTTYYVQASLLCPSTPVPVKATINLKPAPPVVIDQSICGPGTVVLNATDTTTVNWYNDANTGALIHTGSVFVTGYIPNDTVFYVEAFSICSSDRVALNVTITSPPPPVVNDASRCGPGSLVLSAISAAPVFWYDSIVAGNQVGSGLNFLTPSLSQTTRYYVESNNGCATARVEVIAIIHDIPAAPLASDSARCGTGALDLYATANYQIFWYSSPSGGTPLGSGSLFTTPSISQTTTYYTNDIDICGSIRVPVVAMVKPLPASPIGTDGYACGVGAVQLTAAASDPVYWYDQAIGGNLLHTGNSYLTPVLNATTVYYAIAINDCPSYPTAVTATIITPSLVLLGNDTTVLSGSSLMLDAGPGFDSYLWSTGDTTQTIVVNSTNVYSVEVSLGGCSGSDSITVTIINGMQENHSWNGMINVYPNPAKDKIIIQAESKKEMDGIVSISDVAGRILIRKDFQFIGGLNSQTIDLSGLAKGMYFLTLRTSENSVTLNVVVE